MIILITIYVTGVVASYLSAKWYVKKEGDQEWTVWHRLAYGIPSFFVSWVGALASLIAVLLTSGNMNKPAK
jgi:hypothetical protein